VNLRRKRAVCLDVCARLSNRNESRSRFYQWSGQVKYSKRISRNVFRGDRVSSYRLVVDRHTHANVTRLTPASAPMTPALSWAAGSGVGVRVDGGAGHSSAIHFIRSHRKNWEGIYIDRWSDMQPLQRTTRSFNDCSTDLATLATLAIGLA
jgi:hypothetical protein